MDHVQEGEVRGLDEPASEKERGRYLVYMLTSILRVQESQRATVRYSSCSCSLLKEVNARDEIVNGRRGIREKQTVYKATTPR